MYDQLNLKSTKKIKKYVEIEACDFETDYQEELTDDGSDTDEDVHTENVFVTESGFKTDGHEPSIENDGGYKLTTEAIIQEDERYQQAIIDVIENGLSIVASASKN